jgi:imidazolonepropionase-like amidohydrolase
MIVPENQLTPGDGDVVVQAQGQTLLPGLINMHAHLTLASDSAPIVSYVEAHSDVTLALRAAHNAAASLRAGVTTVRDCGSRGRTVLDLRDAIAQGLLDGSRVLAAGCPITISGGHMRPFGGEADGEEGVRRMVRRLVSAGADFIKVAGSGGDTPGSLTEYPSFSLAEEQAVADTAHGLGRRVTMHCTATTAIARAVEAGADSIEHGFFVGAGWAAAYDDVLADRMAEQGISVTPTLQVIRDMSELLPTECERDSWRRRRESLLDHVGRLHRAGVRLTAGSDAGWRLTRFDNFWRELEELVSCGLSTVEAIHAATGAASLAAGRADQFGTLREGLRADLVIVDGDAAHDIRRLANVRPSTWRGVR